MLLQLWEVYAQLLRKQDDSRIQKKQHVLDKFLLEFWTENSTVAGTCLCEMRNVSNELSHEFMRNVFNVTSVMSDSDDLTPLKNYLLQGRGWMLLYTLHSVGLQGVYNRQDLCNILLTLLPICLKIQHSGEIEENSFLHIGIEPALEIDKLFQRLEDILVHGKLDGHEAVQVPKKNRDQSLGPHRKKKCLKQIKHAMEKSLDIDSDDYEKNSLRNKRQHLKRSLKTLSWSSLANEEETASDDDLNDNYDEVDLSDKCINSSELFHLLLTLLHDLVVFDLSDNITQMHSSAILPVLLDALHAFSTTAREYIVSSKRSKSIKLPWNKEISLKLLHHLLVLSMLISAIIATQQNGVRILLSLKTVPAVLAALAYCQLDDDNNRTNIITVRQEIIHDTVIGCLGLFRVVYNFLPFNPSFVRDANALMELFRKHGGEDFFCYLFSLSKGHDCGGKGRHTEPIKWLCNLIRCLKIMKVKYIHAIKCLKRRHSYCDLKALFHHHHGIFGAPMKYILPCKEGSKHLKFIDPSLCQLAKWSCLLLECLVSAQTESTKLMVLHALKDEGVCCCLQPSALINTVIPLLPNMTVPVRYVALESLNTVLLMQFEGICAALKQKTVPCSFCSSNHNSETDLAMHVDSGLGSSELVESANHQVRSRWRSLQGLRQFILSSDESLARSVAKHLITLAVKGNNNIKEELFFGIYLHVLNMKAVEHAGEKYLASASVGSIMPTTVSNSVMLLCISALPYVLQANEVFCLFLENDGLARLTQLLDNQSLRKPVMDVFEALIMLDEETMTSSTSAITATAINQSGQYKGGIVIQTFIDTLAQKTCSITAVFQQLHIKGSQLLSSSSAQLKSCDTCTQKPLRVNKLGCDKVLADHMKDTYNDQEYKCIINTLPALQDMWTTCAKLCMNSETFRVCYRNSPCLYIVQEMLVLAMNILTESDHSINCHNCLPPKSSTEGRHSSLSSHLSRLSFIEAVLIVCFSCQTIQPLQKMGSEEEMWHRIRCALQECVKLEPSKLRAVFDMLLNAAQPQLPSILQFSYAQITSTLFDQEEEQEGDGEEGMRSAHHWHDEHVSAASTDQGYEGDKESASHSDWHADVHGGKPADIPSEQCFPAILRLLIELMVSSQEVLTEPVVLVPVFLRLLHMLRCSKTMAKGACKQGLLGLLLKGFKQVIVSPLPQEHLSLHDVVVATIQMLGQVEISSSELAVLLNFCIETRNLDSVLSTITGIVDNSRMTPSTFLVFPATAFQEHSQQKTNIMSAGIVSEVTAIQCDVKHLNWPPFSPGFSVSLWFSVDHCQLAAGLGNESEDVPAISDSLHLLTLEEDTKSFQVWMHLPSVTLIFRLWSSVNGSMILKDTAVRLSVRVSDWHFLAFSYVDVLDGSTSLGKLSLHVDGHLHEKLVMDHPASIWHRPAHKVSPCLNLGHVLLQEQRQKHGCYNLGPVLLFAESDLSSEFWFHLYALGPTFGALAKFDCGLPSVSYAGLLQKDIISKSSLNHDVLVGIAPVPDIEKAQATQVVYFDPENWTTCCQYGRVVDSATTSLLGLVPSSDSWDALLGQCPQLVASRIRGHMNVSSHINFPHALEQIGGVQSLLFLVAKIFEKSDDDKEEATRWQNKAVQLLLMLLDHCPPVAGTFNNMQGYDMLAVVLRSTSAPITRSLLKVLFDAALSESIFRVDIGSGLMILRQSTESIICNVNVVTQLLLCWQIWQKSEDSIMELVLSAVVLLLHTDHPYHAFNVRQLQAAGIVKILFNIYLERIQEGLPALSSTCSQHVASIVCSVVGQPPDLSLLASLTDFLLQLHPPTTRFINYVHSSFYFLPAWAVDSQAKERERGTVDKDIFQASQVIDKQEREMEHVHFKNNESDSATDHHWNSCDHSAADRSLTCHKMQASFISYPPLEAISESSGLTPDRSEVKSSGTLDIYVSSFISESGDMNCYEEESLINPTEHFSSSSTSICCPNKQTKAKQMESSTVSITNSLASDEQHDIFDDNDQRALLSDHFSRNTSCVRLNSQQDYKMYSENGLDTLCLGLLQFLSKVMQSQVIVDEVFCRVINPLALLVLAQNSSAAIRIAVVQVICYYVWRAPDGLLDDFLKKDGLFLLANQLNTYPACQLQVEAAFSLLFQRSFTFQDHYAVGELGCVAELQQVAPVLVLSMLCRTLPDLSLCHTTLTILLQVVQKTCVMSKVLIDLGLPETLCNLLFAVQLDNIHSIMKDSADREDSVGQILLDVQSLVCQLAVIQFTWSGAAHYQHMEHLFKVLQAMEDVEKTRQDGGIKRADTARALQFAMVVRVLDSVEELSEEVGMSATGLHKAQGKHRTSRTLSSSLLDSSVAITSKPSTQHHSQSMCPVKSTPYIGNGQGYQRQLSAGLVEGRSTYKQSTAEEETRPSFLKRLFSHKKRLEHVPAVHSEILDRFKKLLVLAVDLAVFQERDDKIRPQWQHRLNFLANSSLTSLDDRYLKHMFTFLFQSLRLTLTKENFHKGTYCSLMHSSKEVLRYQLGRIVACLLSSKMEFDQRIFAVSFLMLENGGRDVVRLLTSSQQVCTELGLHVHNLLSEWRDWLTPNHRDLAVTFMTLLRQCGCTIVSPDVPVLVSQAEDLREEKKSLEMRVNREKQAWLSKRATNAASIKQKFQEVVKRVQGNAIHLTQQMGTQQVRERSSLVEHIKHLMATQVQLKKNWQDIVQSLTHERAVWHHADSYPQSWELDPTEGPCRIRRRLMRCHLRLQPKYLQEPFRKKLVCQDKSPPLKYLFEDHHQVADSATLVYKLFTNDTVHNTFVCTCVYPAIESKGELLLGEQYFYFVADGAITDTDFTQILLGNKDQLSMMWRYCELVEVHCRWYQLQDIALEMFVVTGRTHLLAFTCTADRDAVVQLLQCQLDRPKGSDQTLVSLQRSWHDGSLTNFEYLTALNKLAGRSFNDLMQYPVFPFVLRDYESHELDLENPASFRVLHKPIAVQEKSREKKYIDNYEFLRQEIQKPGSDETLHVEPFHYGSHYSNSGTVLHYLVRLPPFTGMFLAYQDNSFDIPDRTFHSMLTSWRLSSFESSTDVKELIPEFFYLPEFLTNFEGFDFGMRQNSEVVNDVLLPPWSQGDPRLFVLIHRQALESAAVTCMLHHWLDLVFGYKQTGEEAVKAINVFHPSTYFGLDVTSVSDPVKRQALLTMIRTYGQTPRQLFTSPHSAHTSSSAVGSQLDKLTYLPRPLSSVNGLRWGKFVGSPEMAQPMCQKISKLPVTVASLVPVVNGPIFGIEADSSLITLQAKTQGASVKRWDMLWAGVLTWYHSDNILRVVSHNSKPTVNLMPLNSYDKVTCCAAALDRGLLFVATMSGSISVFNITHNVAKPSTLHVWGLRHVLCGHQARVPLLQVCTAFGIVVSGSTDHTAIIWDLNRLCYVRTVSQHETALTALAVSTTLGDVATVSNTEKGSELRVHTVNGSTVGRYQCDETIQCLAYSSAPEGRSINVIAGGLSNRVIRLWSSWDVTHLRDLSDDTSISHTILSVAYSSNSQALYVSLADGSVAMWHTDQSAASANASLFLPVLHHVKVNQPSQ